MNIHHWLTGALLLSMTAAVAAECHRGPLYCRTASFPAQLAAKKARLSKDGAPLRLLSLLDHGGTCQGCLDTGPDGFTILNVRPGGDNYTITWDLTNEAISHGMATRGELAAYYIYNSRLGCACDDDQEPADRPDYDAALGLNRSGALECHGGTPTASCP